MIKKIMFINPDDKVTWDHREIKKWVEKHGGKPSIFNDPNAGADKLGIRIDFQGKSDEKFMNDAVQTKEVTWVDFFKIFDKRNLAFIYKQKNEPKDVTMAYKLIPRKNL
jgi:hypothetical protein